MLTVDYLEVRKGALFLDGRHLRKNQSLSLNSSLIWLFLRFNLLNPFQNKLLERRTTIVYGHSWGVFQGDIFGQLPPFVLYCAFSYRMVSQMNILDGIEFIRTFSLPTFETRLLHVVALSMVVLLC